MGKFVALIAVCFAATAASAGEIASVYSDLDLAKCKALQLYTGDEGEGGEWECKGIKGHDVMFWEGDLRGNIAFGPLARSQCSSAQSFGAFNSPGAKIEWRMENGKPFATILRWNVKLEDDERDTTGRVLVVTRLGPGGVCHVGYVDARANPNANELAQQLADEKAREFKCGADKPIVAGKVMPGLTMPKGD